MTVLKPDGTLVAMIIGATGNELGHRLAWETPANPKHQPAPFALYPDETITFA